MGSFEMLTDEAWFEAINLNAMGMIRCVRAALPLLARGVGPHRERLGPLHEAPERAPSRVHGGEGRGHERLEEPVAVARGRRDPREHGLAGQLRDRGAEDVGAGPRHDTDDLYAIMGGIEEHFGHPAHLPRAGDPAEIGAVIAFVGSRRNTYMTGANLNVDGGSDFS